MSVGKVMLVQGNVAKDRTGMTLLEGKLPQKKQEAVANMPLFLGLRE